MGFIREGEYERDFSTRNKGGKPNNRKEKRGRVESRRPTRLAERLGSRKRNSFWEETDLFGGSKKGLGPMKKKDEFNVYPMERELARSWKVLR